MHCKSLKLVLHSSHATLWMQWMAAFFLWISPSFKDMVCTILSWINEQIKVLLFHSLYYFSFLICANWHQETIRGKVLKVDVLYSSSNLPLHTICGILKSTQYTISKYQNLPVKEIFIEHGIIICERLSQPRQASGGDFLQSGLR